MHMDARIRDGAYNFNRGADAVWGWGFPSGSWDLLDDDDDGKTFQRQCAPSLLNAGSDAFVESHGESSDGLIGGFCEQQNLLKALTMMDEYRIHRKNMQNRYVADVHFLCATATNRIRFSMDHSCYRSLLINHLKMSLYIIFELPPDCTAVPLCNGWSFDAADTVPSSR